MMKNLKFDVQKKTVYAILSLILTGVTLINIDQQLVVHNIFAFIVLFVNLILILRWLTSLKTLLKYILDYTDL